MRTVKEMGVQMARKSTIRSRMGKVSAAVLVTSMAVAGASVAPVATAAQPINLAFLTASSANTWLQTSLTEMKKIAAKNNIKITIFDAAFKGGVQAGQIQDVIASGKYKALIITSLDGAAIIPSLLAAEKAGIKVATLNQVVGTNLNTAKPQLAGVVANVMVPPQISGVRLGKLTLKACANLNPCNVVYFYGIKGIPLDNAIKLGFDSVISTNPNIKVVADGEGKYLAPDTAQKAMQDIMTSTPEFNVVTGSDQSIQGVALALSDAGKTGVKLIGFGGSKPAIDGIKDGSWFGDVFGAPGTEGKLVMNAMVKALKTGKMTGGIDTGSTLPDNAMVTAANVSKFTPEWNG